MAQTATSDTAAIDIERNLTDTAEPRLVELEKGAAQDHRAAPGRFIEDRLQGSSNPKIT